MAEEQAGNQARAGEEGGADQLSTTDYLHRRFGSGYETVTGVSQVQFRHPDTAAKLWIFSSVFWFVVVTSFGTDHRYRARLPRDLRRHLLARLQPRAPMSTWRASIFAWLSMMYWGAILFHPASARHPQPLEREAGLWIGLYLQRRHAAGFVGILTGATQGRECAEFPWPVDVVIICSLRRAHRQHVDDGEIRRVRPLYVSMWWAIAAPIWVSASISIENVVWRPGDIWSNPSGALATGIHDAMINWWGNHNLFGLWLTPVLIAVVYYFVPRITNTPLYSHTLSLISFWGLIFVYAAVGDHHLLQTPTPGWLKTIAPVNSVAILIPVFAFFTQHVPHHAGAVEPLLHQPALEIRARPASSSTSSSTCRARCRPSSRSTSTSTSPTSSSGTRIWRLLGGFTILGMGVLYYVIPHIFNKPLYSTALAEWQYWLVTFGFLPFLTVGHHRRLRSRSGLAGGIPEVNVLPRSTLWNIVRALAGG